MKNDIEVTVKIPVEWIKEIDTLLNNKELDGHLPEYKSYESFIMQALLNEMRDLNDIIGIKMETSYTAYHPVPDYLRELPKRMLMTSAHT